MARVKSIDTVPDRRKINWRAHLIGASLGLLALAASIVFPGQKSFTQIALVTVMVAYLAIGDVWVQRREPGFGTGLLIAVVSHVVLWAVLWKYLPMHILNIVMIAGIEGVALLVLMYKTLNTRE